MSDSEETQTPETSSPGSGKNNSSGSSSPPSSDGNESDQLSANLQESGEDNSPSAPSPSTNPSNSSPPPDDSSNGQSSSAPSDSEPPATSPPPPPPQASPPPPNIPPPPSAQSSPQTSPSSSSGSPPSPPVQQSPPPPPSSPTNQQSPPPPSNPSQESSKPSPEKSSPPSPSPPPPPPPSVPSDSSQSSTSPPPPSTKTSQSPPSENSTSTPSTAFSPPSINGNNTTASPGFSQALAPTAPSPPKSLSNSSGGSSSQPGGSTNNNRQNDVKDAKKPHTDVVIGVTVAGVFLVAFIALVFFIRRRKKRRRPIPYANYMPPPANFAVTSDEYVGHSAPTNAAYYNSQHGQQSNFINSFGSQRGQNYHSPDSGIIAGSKIFFSYEELMEMTNGFARENVIGEGGFGCVYKGWMPDGRPVAVKQLKAGSGQGEREFRAEVEIISRVHHRHLVSLVGYCIAENQRLLIYEFVANKTLEHHLHSKQLPVLEWAQRVKIAVGAAKGLAYLHEDCHPKIIHRDIKSANILLEDDFEAQVADFGLARLNDTTQTHVSTRVMGTFGYLAPEYASSGKLTDRSDVYSFGVVLLELITGRKPVDPTQPLGDESLVEWARPLLIQALETGDFGEVIDPRLKKRYVESEMSRMIEAAAACVRHSAAKRPRMALVARALDFSGESDLSNGVKFGQSTAYDSGQYSEEIMKFRRMALGSDNSSESEMYSGEYNSREVSRGQLNSWQSRNSSGDFTSGELETQAFKPNSGDYSGASWNHAGGRYK